VARWLLVGLYVVSIVSFTTAHSSGAGYMGELLRKWFPHLSGSQIQALVFWMRKAGHVAAYAVLTVLIVYASRGTPRLRKYALGLGVVGAVLVAVVDEYLQTGLDHRTGAVSDVVIDCVGIGLALVIMAVIGARRGSPNGRDSFAENESR
jgi:VanZ family protein